MVPTWASPTKTISDACGFQMGPIWAYVYAYHVGPTWFLHGTLHLKLYGTHVGYRWVPYGPSHVPNAWVPDGFHMGQPTCATYGSQMGYVYMTNFELHGYRVGPTWAILSATQIDTRWVRYGHHVGLIRVYHMAPTRFHVGLTYPFPYGSHICLTAL